jgi:hypothetical protein
MLSLILASLLSSAPVEVHQISGVSFECVCHSDAAPAGFDCSDACRAATQEYIRTHDPIPAENCNVNPDNCVDVSKVE